MDEQGKEDELIGLGLNGQEFTFPTPIVFHSEMKTFANGTTTNENGPCLSGGFGISVDNCIGMSQVFKYMKTLLPGGDALFQFHQYVYEEWDGQSSGKDDLFLQSVEFYSYPSVAENRNLYLIRRNQPGSSEAIHVYYNNSDRQISHVYPIKVDVDS
jgi:hypothetical protein